jgi:hypothetical protein
MSFATPGQENAAQIEQLRMRVFIVILIKAGNPFHLNL